MSSKFRSSFDGSRLDFGAVAWLERGARRSAVRKGLKMNDLLSFLGMLIMGARLRWTDL
jgi:hypothetical protein